MSITSILCKNGGQPPCNTIASSYKATKIIISQNNPEHKFENTFVNYFSVNSRGGREAEKPNPPHAKVNLNVVDWGGKVRQFRRSLPRGQAQQGMQAAAVPRGRVKDRAESGKADSCIHN